MTDLTGLLEEARAARQFSGASCAIGTKDETIEAGAIGTTAWDDGADVSLATVLDIASLTKPLVAIQALVLAQAGQLGLYDRIASFLPDYRDGDKADVTLFQLLTHSSGIPGQQPLYRTCRTREHLLDAVRLLPLRFAPGSGVSECP